jgi:thioredoxin 1
MNDSGFAEGETRFVHSLSFIVHKQKHMSEVTLNDSNFDSEVVEFSKTMPVLVDFWASWCPPCRIMGPVVEELAKEFAGKIKVGKYNVEEGTATAEKMNVQGIPAFFIFKGGVVVDSWTGALAKEEVVKKIEAVLK